MPPAKQGLVYAAVPGLGMLLKLLMGFFWLRSYASLTSWGHWPEMIDYGLVEDAV